jgi:hypothetical protein
MFMSLRGPRGRSSILREDARTVRVPFRGRLLRPCGPRNDMNEAIRLDSRFSDSGYEQCHDAMTAVPGRWRCHAMTATIRANGCSLLRRDHHRL